MHVPRADELDGAPCELDRAWGGAHRAWLEKKSTRRDQPGQSGEPGAASGAAGHSASTRSRCV